MRSAWIGRPLPANIVRSRDSDEQESNGAIPGQVKGEEPVRYHRFVTFLAIAGYVSAATWNLGVLKVGLL
jgi:hypothetical protein